MNLAAQIAQVHSMYCHLTGQRVSLRFDRERMWYELLREGYTEADVRRVIRYLQREIREGRRNVGALKLSNLLQVDRFEEDFNISRVRLAAPSAVQTPTTAQPPSTQPPITEEERQRARDILQQFRRDHLR